MLHTSSTTNSTPPASPGEKTAVSMQVARRHASPARQKVFATPELLELILLHLDLRTLLTVVQRVSRGWKAFIRSSAPLRRELYLPSYVVDDTISSDGTSRPAGGERFGPPLFSPLLQEVFPSWFKGKGISLPGFYEFSQEPFASIADVFMGRDHPQQQLDEGAMEQREISNAPTGAAAANTTACNTRLLDSITPSWRKMLVQQDPPIRTICVWERSMSWLGTIVIVAKLLRAPAGGLRMGQYYDMATGFVLDDGNGGVFWPADRDKVLGIKDFTSQRCGAGGLPAGRTIGFTDSEVSEIQEQKEVFVAEADLILHTVKYSNFCGSEFITREWDEWEDAYLYDRKKRAREVQLEEVREWKITVKDAWDGECWVGDQ
ncbi:F-box domain-containing protein [Microdochium nivale]|nr:F-box domain-containing protein [Microdochium nivale]